jgi:hypothetical protein
MLGKAQTTKTLRNARQMCLQSGIQLSEYAEFKLQGTLTRPRDSADSKLSPRTESLVTAAVQWADRIMRRIHSVLV